MSSQLSRALILGVGALVLAACGKAPSAQQAQHQPPPPEVAVVDAKAQSVPIHRDFVGRLAATRVAEVRARVAGIILKRVYSEGTDVKQGQVLFQIDPAQLEAALHSKQAALAKAQADATNAAQTAKRDRKLNAKGLLSPQDLDTALANERIAAAAVKQAQADVESARLNLSYATVTAPISGLAGRALVTEGALVGQGEATQLTTIEQVDPIYVNFSQSVAELQDIQAASHGNNQPEVQVTLPNGAVYPHKGTLDYSDPSVNPQTGAVSLRASLPNPDHHLLPGMFVSVRVAMGQLQHAFMLPQAAVTRAQQGAYVMVVNQQGKVEQRNVETHGMTRTDWIATGDLHDGDQVIVEGLQKVRPGVVAKAVSAERQASTRP